MKLYFFNFFKYYKQTERQTTGHRNAVLSLDKTLGSLEITLQLILTLAWQLWGKWTWHECSFVKV